MADEHWHRGEIRIKAEIYDRLKSRGWSHVEICSLVEDLIVRELGREKRRDESKRITEHGDGRILTEHAPLATENLERATEQVRDGEAHPKHCRCSDGGEVGFRSATTCGRCHGEL